MENLKITLLIIGISLAACTAPIDRDYVLDGPRNPMFSADLRDCKQMARTYRSETRTGGALVGAMSGAAFGALDADQDADQTVAQGAFIGAGIGALVGLSTAQQELSLDQRNVVIRCLQNRGHKVIG